MAPSQARFILRIQTCDNIIVAQELAHSIRKCKCKVGFMAIEIDLEKAYMTGPMGFSS